MDLNLSEDEALVERAFADFFTSESPISVVRAAEPLGFDEQLWAKVVELGAPVMGVPSASGGSGVSTTGLVIALQQMGRQLAPVPLVESMVASNLLARAGASDLLGVMQGGAVGTVGLRPVQNRVSRLAPAGAVADIAIVLDDDKLLAVRRSGARPHRKPAPNFGATPIADIGLDEQGAEIVTLASGPQALKLYRGALNEWTLLTAAALDGLRSAALEIGVAYVKQRKAFGVELANFQAIQHRFAELASEGDGAQLLLYRAAWSRDSGGENWADLALMDFLFLKDVAFKTARESLQFHGGYGFTLEYDIQLYLRRAKAWPLLFGDPRTHYARLADNLYPMA